MSRPFRFKRFTIVQEVSAMKVGTDGVLLGAWCGVDANDRTALDIGTGTGLVALMVAQRGEDNPLAVDAVEIDAPTAEEARVNVGNSPWHDSVTVHAVSVQDFARTADRRYDLIVSNPPFFSDSLLPPDGARTAARHTVSLDYDGLVRVAAELLAERGRLCVVIPHEHAAGFRIMAQSCGMGLRRLTAVIPKPGVLPKRALMEFVREPYVPLVPHEEELLIELGSRHEYSDAYKELTRGFYLKF